MKYNHLMIEEASNIHDSSKLNLVAGSTLQIEDEYTFDPIQDLGLQINHDNPNDKNELDMILKGILNFPSDTLAEFHAEAMRLGNFDLEEQTKKAQENSKDQAVSHITKRAKHCRCCGFKQHDESIKMCTSFDDISNMGTSTYLFFITFKHLGTLLAVLTAVYSIFALATNIVASKNSSLGSSYTVDYLTISLASKQSNPTDQNKTFYYIQAWLGMVVIIVWIAIFMLNRYHEYKESQEYDEDTISASDYSVSLQGVPLDLTKEEIQASFNKYYERINASIQIPENRKRPLNVVKLNIGKPYYLADDQLQDKQLEDIEKELKERKDTLREWILERQTSKSFSETEANRKAHYQRLAELVRLREEKYKAAKQNLINKLKKSKSQDLTTVFVTFDTNIARNFVLHFNDFNILDRFKVICGNSNKYTFERGDEVYAPDVDRAPEPEDIIWANIGRSDCNTALRKVFIYTATGLLLGGCFMIVYGLSKAQQDQNNNRLLSIAISIVIAVVNIALGVVIKFLTLFEKDYTSTNRQTSLAMKSIVAQMINSILTPVITAYYIKTDTGVYQTGGLVDNIFMMGITNSLVPPILLFFDPYNLFVKVMRYLKSTNKSKLQRTQKEHNLLYQGVQFEVGYEYIYIVNLFMFVCFFVSLQPIVSAFALVGYLLMYWVEKYCMFYRYKRPVPGTDFVNKSIYQLVFLGPLIYALGSLTWSNFDPMGIPKEALLPNLLAVAFAAILLILPINPILLSCCIDDNSVVKQTKYQDDRFFFPTQYDRSNPATILEGITDYKSFMQRKHTEISKKSKEEQQAIQRRKMIGWQRGALNEANAVNFGANQMQTLNPANLGFLLGNQAVQPPVSQPRNINSNAPVQMGNGGYGMQMGMNQMGNMNPMGMNPMGAMMGGLNPYSPQQFSPNGFGGYPGGFGQDFGGYGQQGFGGGYNGW